MTSEPSTGPSDESGEPTPDSPGSNGPHSPDGNTAAVECENLTKVFRKWFGRISTTAVDGLDLTIRPGEIFGLLGPNGSGKTTTMKLLLGLLFPTSGDARVLNRSAGHVSTRERIGFLPEESYLYDFLTGKETLEFYGSLFGMDRSRQSERVESLLKKVDLWSDRNRALREYSKGMTRRIGFAQALINDPDVIFLDEPTVGLDPIIARQLKNLMCDLRDRGKTLIVSSHVLADIEDVFDRVAILHDGVKRKEGDVEEMLEIRDRMQVVLDAPGNPETTREQLRTLLEDNGWNIRSFSHPGRTLEDLFLSTIQESNTG